MYEVLNEFVKGHEWTTEEDQDLLQKLLRSEVKPRPNGDIGFVFAPEDPRFPRNYFSFWIEGESPIAEKFKEFITANPVSESSVSVRPASFFRSNMESLPKVPSEENTVHALFYPSASDTLLIRVNCYPEYGFIGYHEDLPSDNATVKVGENSFPVSQTNGPILSWSNDGAPTSYLSSEQAQTLLNDFLSKDYSEDQKYFDLLPTEMRERIDSLIHKGLRVGPYLKFKFRQNMLIEGGDIKGDEYRKIAGLKLYAEHQLFQKYHDDPGEDNRILSDFLQETIDIPRDTDFTNKFKAYCNKVLLDKVVEPRVDKVVEPRVDKVVEPRVSWRHDGYTDEEEYALLIAFLEGDYFTKLLEGIKPELLTLMNSQIEQGDVGDILVNMHEGTKAMEESDQRTLQLKIISILKLYAEIELYKQYIKSSCDGDTQLNNFLHLTQGIPKVKSFVAKYNEFCKEKIAKHSDGASHGINASL